MYERNNTNGLPKTMNEVHVSLYGLNTLAERVISCQEQTCIELLNMSLLEEYPPKRTTMFALSSDTKAKTKDYITRRAFLIFKRLPLGLNFAVTMVCPAYIRVGDVKKHVQISGRYTEM